MAFLYLLSRPKSFKSVFSIIQADNLNFLRKLLADDVDFSTFLSHINFKVPLTKLEPILLSFPLPIIYCTLI